jgi:hypothetical protein
MASALSDKERALIDAYWRAANYLSLGQIYLYDNPLLKESLTKEHIKPLLGHQSDDPGFIAWARKHRVRGVLVRPDRFIAARLNADPDLSILSLFAGAKAAALPRAA